MELEFSLFYSNFCSFKFIEVFVGKQIKNKICTQSTYGPEKENTQIKQATTTQCKWKQSEKKIFNCA